MTRAAQEIVGLLEQKLELLERRAAHVESLATRPRESLRAAVEQEIRSIDAQVFRIDAEFIERYRIYRASLPTNASGEIDADSLAASKRAELRRIQNIIRKIAATAFHPCQDTV